MKRDGYPEDSAQSAYSSQLIRIPPLCHQFFIFPTLFLERQLQDTLWAVIGISYWGMGGGHLQTRTNTHLPSTFQSEAVCIRYDDVMSPSLAAFIFLLIQTSSAFSQFVLSLLCLGRLHRASYKVSERVYCLVRLTNEPRLHRLLARLTLSIA